MSAIDKAIADINAVKPRSIDILGQPSTLSQEQETDKTTPSVEIEKEKKPKIQKIEKKSKSNDCEFGHLE